MFKDTDYYDPELLQGLIPGLPPRVGIGFCYCGDIEDFNELMDAWEARDEIDFSEDDYEMELEDWMPKVRGYWNTGFAPCACLCDTTGHKWDNFEYDQCDIGRNPDEERYRGRYSRSQWLRDILEYFAEDVSAWDWSGDRLKGYDSCDERMEAFSCKTELLIYQENFLSWYDKWVEQGRPVRALSFDGDTNHPVFGDYEYEER